MSFPQTCPFCGAAIAVGDDGKKRVADLCVIFDCGTGSHELMDPTRTRSRVCKDITCLAARVAELEERCKRLEHLGSNLRLCAGYLGSTASDDSDCITRAERACEAWDKEAKG